MSRFRTVRMPIWRALLDGHCKQIHKSRDQLWKELRNNNAWYTDENANDWKLVVSDEDVRVAEGSRHDWSAEGGCGGVHVHYICPYCNEEHYTDDDPNDVPPFLWFCERSDNLILVTVDGKTIP